MNNKICNGVGLHVGPGSGRGIGNTKSHNVISSVSSGVNERSTDSISYCYLLFLIVPY